MMPDTLLWILLGILTIDFGFQKILDFLQNKARKRAVPEGLKDVYDAESYRNQQKYHLEHYRVDAVVSLFLFLVVFVMLLHNGFGSVYSHITTLELHPILNTLLFFAILALALEVIQLPVSWYSTFSIEERYGFNTTTIKTFWLDKLKGLLVTGIIGGGLLALLNIVYLQLQESFWWIAWCIIALFTLFMNAFYTKLLLPLFNKLEPLPDGDLKDEIQLVAKKADFRLDKIFLMDSSKRSKKANAFFTGFGKRKTIVLFDTLKQQLNNKEIAAVLAHEIGHYKKKHTLLHMIGSLFTTGLMLWLFSLVADSPLLAKTMGISQPAFAISLLVFSFLFVPINFLLTFFFNCISRHHEYQADRFAARILHGEYLVSALKRLTAANFSHLTPHKLYVLFEYSHPPLKDRISHIEKQLVSTE
jgi:STE24 endopeptidase